MSVFIRLTVSSLLRDLALKCEGPDNETEVLVSAFHHWARVA